MNTTTVKHKLIVFGWFLAAYVGSAACLLASMGLLSTADSWFASRRFAFPLYTYGDPLRGLLFLAVGALVATAVVLFCIALPLRLLRRESLGAYLALCGALPLISLFFTWTDGLALVMACSAMIAAAFWWFAYRRPNLHKSSGGATTRWPWAFLFLGIAAFGGFYWTEYSAEQRDEAERQRIHEPQPIDGAVVGKDALLFDFKGRLSSYDLASGKRRLVLPKGVTDVAAVGDGSAWILSVPPLPDDRKYDEPLPAGSFTLFRYRAGKVEAFLSQSYGPNERPLVIAIHDGEPILFGRSAAFFYESTLATWRKLAFDHPIRDQLWDNGGTAVVSPDGRRAYVGMNIGEWGGGLAVVDLNGGKVERPERRGPDLCDGPLNSDCDPVTGIVIDPQEPDCVLASIGLSHLLSHGRVIRLCPDGISVEFERLIDAPGRKLERTVKGVTLVPFREGFIETEPIDALAQTRDGSIWAITPYAAYRRERDGWSRRRLPELEYREDLAISEQLPDLVLLTGGRSGRYSMSGWIPMVLPGE